MKRMKRFIRTLLAGLMFAVMTVTLMVMIGGALMWVAAFVTDTAPTTLENIGIIFVMLIGGGIGAVWYFCDTEADDE